MFKTLSILVVAFAAFMIVSAQSPQREIYTVLSYGDDVFEPDMWLTSASELGSHTTATWSNYAEGALAYADYLHFDDGFDVETTDDVFNERYFDVTLSGYESWRELNNCVFESEDETDSTYIRLYEFSLEQNSVKYVMRYWITPTEDDTRVLAIFVLYPADNVTKLDDYAALLFPDAVACEDNGVG